MDKPHEIVVYRTHVEITNYEMGDFPYIEKKHSIKKMITKTYFKLEPKGMEYDSERKVLMLPRGVDIDKMKWMLGDTTTIRVIREFDPAEPMDRPLNIKYTPKNEDQKLAIKFIMGMNPYEYTQNYTMLSLNLNTGKGKTYCAIASLSLRKMRCAVITTTSGCLDQWYNFFQEYTDIIPDEICYITPTNMRRIMSTGKKYSVYLMLHSTVRAYANHYGWSGVGDLFKFMGVGIKVYDESHLDMDNMFRIDCATNTFLTLYLTATPNRSSFEENEIFKEYFTGTPFIDLFNRDLDPHTKYAAIKFNSQPSAKQMSDLQNAYGLNRLGYTGYIIRQESFHQLLHILVSQALNKPGKSLWYIGTNAGILYIRDWLIENYPELTNYVGTYYGEIDKNDRQAELEKKIILSNTKSAGAAMDIAGLVETIVLAEPFKSKVLAQQTFGRTRADGTIYKDIVDTGFPQLRKYYNAKRPVFAKYATECVEVTMKPNELEDRANKIIRERNHLYTPFSTLDERTGEMVKKYRYVFFDESGNPS